MVFTIRILLSKDIVSTHRCRVCRVRVDTAVIQAASQVVEARTTAACAVAGILTNKVSLSHLWTLTLATI